MVSTDHKGPCQCRVHKRMLVVDIGCSGAMRHFINFTLRLVKDSRGAVPHCDSPRALLFL